MSHVELESQAALAGTAAAPQPQPEFCDSSLLDIRPTEQELNHKLKVLQLYKDQQYFVLQAKRRNELEQCSASDKELRDSEELKKQTEATRQRLLWLAQHVAHGYIFAGLDPGNAGVEAIEVAETFRAHQDCLMTMGMAAFKRWADDLVPLSNPCSYPMDECLG